MAVSISDSQTIKRVVWRHVFLHAAATSYCFHRISQSIRLGLGRFSGFENRPGGLSRGVETYFNTSPVKGMDLRSFLHFHQQRSCVTGQGLAPEYVIPKHLFGLTLTQRYRALLFSFDLNRTGSYIAPVFENNFPFRHG